MSDLEKAMVVEVKAETMADYAAELEASYRRLRAGDLVTGTVVDVDEKNVTLDLDYYAPGKIPVEEMSADPHYHVLDEVRIGDSITATVLQTDDGAGNLLLSCKEASEILAWGKLKTMMEEKTVVHGKIGGIVHGGAIMYVEGVRGFIPASRLDLHYVEDTEAYLNRELDVLVTEVDEAKKRVILSAKELLMDKAIEEKNKKISRIQVGTVVEGTVEQLKDYGAFVDLGDGISGLLHISQISDRKLKSPKQVLSVGGKVKVMITKIENHKLSLSMKAAQEATAREAVEEEAFDYQEEGSATTGLGALLSGIKLS